MGRPRKRQTLSQGAEQRGVALRAEPSREYSPGERRVPSDLRLEMVNGAPALLYSWAAGARTVTDEHKILAAFADLAVGDEATRAARVLRFAQAHGPLLLPGRGRRPHSSPSDRRTASEAAEDDFWVAVLRGRPAEARAELVGEWLYWAGKVRALVTIYTATVDGRPGDPDDWRAVRAFGDSESPGAHLVLLASQPPEAAALREERQRRGRPVEELVDRRPIPLTLPEARSDLLREVQWLISWTNAAPRVRWTEGRGYSVALEGAGALGAVAVELLATMVEGKPGLTKCGYCEGLYAAKQRPQKNKPGNCRSESCERERNRLQKEAKRREERERANAR